MRRSLVSSVALIGAVFGFAAACTAALDAETPAVASPMAAQSPQFDEMMLALAAGVDARVKAGVPVPIPVDAGGGYTHEQHKQNAKTIYEAGMLYQQTGDAKYRDAVRDILFDYAELYPTLDIHPEQRSFRAC